MDVVDAVLVCIALRLVVGLLVWWFRARWQVRTEQHRSQTVMQLAAHLQRTGGRLLERRGDGSVLDLTVVRFRDDR
ncbi:hypothetical protein [Actinophytocola glycyrrhizae]|uniref:hypothetical protein n=1 Tax=Actinophytocola glycyrrhizae TaxID=2044873 RepID=UPI00366D02AD